MKYRKTYQYPGLMEAHCQLHMGNLVMPVSFTGGCQTAYGVQAAQYTTDKEFVQKFIERSDEYRCGKITLANQYEIEEEAAAVEEAAAPASVVEHKVVEMAPAANAVVVEVADKNEAIEYLKENFGGEYTATKLRTKGAFEAACQECNVTFNFSE